MSEDDNITLSYNNIEVKIKIPETFPELQEIFIEKFHKDKKKHFRFYYLDDEEDEIDIDNDSNYIYSLNELKQQRNPIIKVEKAYNKERFDESESDEEYIEDLNIRVDPMKSGYNFSKVKNSLEVKNLNNNNLNEEIINLKNELEKKSKIIEEQKEKILNLESQNDSINLELNNKNFKIQDLQNKLKLKEIELMKINKDLNNKNEELNNKIEELNNKNEEINKLKMNYNNKDEKYSKKDGIDFAVNFISVNQDIIYPIPCRLEDSIVKLEEQLYNEYPKYKDYNTYLTVNGNIVKRFKTIKENGIKKGNAIMVNIYE